MPFKNDGPTGEQIARWIDEWDRRSFPKQSLSYRYQGWAGGFSSVQSFNRCYPESKLAMAPDKGGTMRLVGFSGSLPAGATQWCYKGESAWRTVEEHDRITKPLLFGDDEEETPQWKGE